MAKKTTKGAAKSGAAKRLKITLVKSTIGFNRTQDETVDWYGTSADQSFSGAAGHA